MKLTFPITRKPAPDRGRHSLEGNEVGGQEVVQVVGPSGEAVVPQLRGAGG